MVTVLIRNKNESSALAYLLNILTTRFAEDIKEIIVVDNQSTDNSLEIIKQFGCTLVPLEKFGYGRALNLGISNASTNIVVNISSHCYPVSKDFFKNAEMLFEKENSIAGVRFLLSDGDYRNFLLGRTAKDDMNRCGLFNACSAIRKDLWEKHPFHDTMSSEDKEWTRYFLQKGYNIAFVESFGCYHMKRTKAGLFKRYKGEFLAASDLYGKQINYKQTFKSFLRSIYNSFRDLFVGIRYSFKNLVFHLSYLIRYKK